MNILKRSMFISCLVVMSNNIFAMETPKISKPTHKYDTENHGWTYLLSISYSPNEAYLVYDMRVAGKDEKKPDFLSKALDNVLDVQFCIFPSSFTHVAYECSDKTIIFDIPNFPREGEKRIILWDESKQRLCQFDKSPIAKSEELLVALNLARIKEVFALAKEQFDKNMPDELKQELLKRQLESLKIQNS